MSADDVRAAALRLEGRVRRTPVIELQPALGPGRVWLKLESLQRSGSFKLRGALNAALTLEPRPAKLVTASGGNHGAGVASAGRDLGLPVEVFLPETTPESKRAKLRALGAEVRILGAVWDDADEAARAAGQEPGVAYVHPFADPPVIAGNGTLGLELLEQVPDLACVLIAIGGGGLIGGCALALKDARPDLRLIGVEPEGAPTLERSLAAGELVTLPAIETRATSLAPRRSARINLELAQAHVERVVLVSDAELQDAADWLAREYGLHVELSAAAGLAAVLSGRFTPPAEGSTCLVACGAS